MSQNGWIAVIVGLLIIAAGAWWFTSGNQNAGNEAVIPAPQDTTPATTDGGTQVGVDVNVNTTPTMATVTYNGSNFSPAEVTIKKGDKVTFTSTAGNMWVASGPHPEHTKYDGTARSVHCAAGAAPSFDQCAAGTSYTFTFDKVGTWPYHNHVNAGVFGKVVVVE